MFRQLSMKGSAKGFRVKEFRWPKGFQGGTKDLEL